MRNGTRARSLRALGLNPVSVLTVALAAALIGVGASGCSCDEPGNPNDGGPGTDGGGGMDGGTGTDGGGIDAFVPEDAPPVILADGRVVCTPVSCDGRITACGDCMDNDGDGRIDSSDRECLGPCDNTEDPELDPGVGGGTGAQCGSDCYFDFGNGPGNDNCVWDRRCDPHEPKDGCSFDPDEVDGRNCPLTQDEQCISTCQHLTPNGCDCFGCCTFDALAGRADADGGEWVFLGSRDAAGNPSCTFDDVLDTAACRPCTPVRPGQPIVDPATGETVGVVSDTETCFNDCGVCELCLGRETLPPECLGETDAGVGVDAGIPARCPPAVQPCGLPGDAECPTNYYCITGCCQETLI